MNTDAISVERVQLKLNPKDKTNDELKDNEPSKVFVLDFDGTRPVTSKFGTKYMISFHEQEDGTPRIAFLSGKERSGVYGKTVVELFNGMKKGAIFTITRSPRQGKDANKSYILYFIGSQGSVNLEGVQKLINYAKEHQLSKGDLEQLAIRSECTPEEIKAVLDGYQ